jgi:hypothetical protein
VSVRKFSTASILSPSYKNSKIWDGETFPGYFESIQTVIASTSTASLEFVNIPQNYTHLQIRGVGRSTIADTNDFAIIKFNSDSGANYTYHYLRGDGASVSAQGSGYGSPDYLRSAGFISAANATSGVFGATIVDILDYTNTNKLKTIRTITGKEANSGNADGRVYLWSMLWGSTSAITTITLTTQANWAQYSQFALYGIRSA